MHSQMEMEFAAEPDVVFMYVQTVFEGAFTNTFANGLVDLDSFGVEGIYGFDPRTDIGGLPATMKMFATQGTPYTIILGRDGVPVMSEFTGFASQVRVAIDTALATGG